MIARVGGHLRDFRFRDLVRENPTNSLTLRVYLQHYARRIRPVQAKEFLENVDDKLHGSVIVIEQNHLVQRRLFDLGSGFFDDDAVIGGASGVLIRHGSLYMGRQTAPQACDDGPSLPL